jgi:hypothetical protein
MTRGGALTYDAVLAPLHNSNTSYKWELTTYPSSQHCFLGINTRKWKAKPEAVCTGLRSAALYASRPTAPREKSPVATVTVLPKSQAETRTYLLFDIANDLTDVLCVSYQNEQSSDKKNSTAEEESHAHRGEPGLRKNLIAPLTSFFVSCYLGGLLMIRFNLNGLEKSFDGVPV